MSTHVIHFYGPITPGSFEGFRNCALQALAQGMTEIKWFFSSDGGDLSTGFAAYNFIRSLPVPISVHNMGNIESIAIMLYLACDKRFTVPSGKFKLHAFNWNFSSTSVDHNRLAEASESLEFDVNRYTEIFNERTQGACEPINIKDHLLGRALILDAVAAVRSKIATDIADAAIDNGATNWWVNIMT